MFESIVGCDPWE